MDDEPYPVVIASEAKQSRAAYARSGLPRRFAPRNDEGVYCFSNAAWISRSTVSLTAGMPKAMPKSLRLIVASALKPIVAFLLYGLLPAPWESTSRVTGLVTPLRVRLPVTLA